jgi:hypothetical protein
MHDAEGMHDAAPAGSAMFEGLASTLATDRLLIELDVAAVSAVLQ